MPLLGEPIVAAKWQRLNKDLGVTALDYSTCRILEGTRKSSQSAASHIQGRSIQLGPMRISLETVPENLLKECKAKGFEFYEATALLDDSLIPGVIENALQLIQLTPTLFRTIAIIVRCIHVLRPEDEHHDVSFSLPDIPFSIFVSVPEKSDPYTTLRVAEAIIHEAMHLQLTLIEHSLPMVIESDTRFFSPWRNEERSISGILHAVYVFAAIDAWLNTLPSTLINTHIRKRRGEIAKQMQQIMSFPTDDELTPCGQLLFRRLISGFE